MDGLLRADATAAAGMCDAAPGAIRLGMPHLARGGLSENWLLKELGHRHWLLLAGAAGRSVPDFRDERGAPVYAAFCAVALSGCDFAAVRENGVLSIASTLARVSRTQVGSWHDLACDGRAIGRVTLLSTFVRRGPGGGNHVVARVEVDGLPPVAGPNPASDLAARAARRRAVREAASAPAGEGAAFTFDPCPSLDFNGAGFLYFASFVALVDRAEWRMTAGAADAPTTVDRDVVYLGNADPGETVTVRFVAWRDGPADLAHRCVLERGSDGAAIAEVVSHRRRT